MSEREPEIVKFAFTQFEVIDKTIAIYGVPFVIDVKAPLPKRSEQLRVNEDTRKFIISLDMTHQHLASCGCCQNVTAASTIQTLHELDFERGIWSAALNGEIQKIREYLNKDGDPNVVDSSGYHALHYAARSGHVDICRLLLNHGACVNACTRSGNVTPLHRAAYSGQVDVVRLLLEQKASVCHQDADGKTALHKAAEMGHLECARILVAADSKAVGIVDGKGKVAKDFAPQHNIVIWESLLQTVPS